MLYSEERKNKIHAYVEKHKRASVQHLCDAFNVSESTIRRDLSELEQDHLLRRTHGGAIAFESVNFEPTVTEKADRFQKEKQIIATRAASYIQEGDTILIDAGTTTLPLIYEIKHFSSLTVVTNSVVHSELLKDSPQIEVVVPGGRLRHETQALVGPITDQTLSLLHVDKAFIGTNGIDLSDGLTTPNLIEASTKRTMISQSSEVIVLADHSKFEKVTFAKFGDIDDIDRFITDEQVDQSFVSEFHQRGVKLDIVLLQED
ncbi:DeoR/GlpR family DNA-binding transcription regulator [Alkalibacillus haloalkaliphilus]|uniref:DeoR family transcriptional regulator n=1 Tax=Alkalibacillus haloalkaliphilus TaxID=94136 RepID=A0A511W7J7_9BACI|nr:DeoR/GlpR family DNA-binding transcription regulator [Alkalibacillus haloalkaliphilus]GEN46298.1 DeoR family transcriptional regulator [Alkalibacillus haloalkaliphilus]